MVKSAVLGIGFCFLIFILFFYFMWRINPNIKKSVKRHKKLGGVKQWFGILSDKTNLVFLTAKM